MFILSHQYLIYNLLIKDMSNRAAQTTVTALTSEQEQILFDEMDKIDKRLAELYNDLSINAQELPELVQMANEMTDPQGDDQKFVNDVREAEKCQQNIKDFERCLNDGLREEDYQIESIQNLIYFPSVTMDDNYRASVIKTSQRFRFNLVQMYLRGRKGFSENYVALSRNQNDLERALEWAIKAMQPSELDKVTADLKARLEKLGAPAIKNIQEELKTMFKLSRDPNPIKRKNAESQIPGLEETLKVHQRMCNLSIQALLKKHSLQVTTVEGVDEHLSIEIDEFNRIKSQGILGRVPIVEAKVADLKNLKEFMIQKDLTDKILEGPEPEPFYQLPNWKKDIYPHQPYPKRLEMLDELLQQNLYVDYSEVLATETEIEASQEYRVLIRILTPRITSSQWENVSYLLYQYFIKGKLNVHSAMKIYYVNQMQPIVDPLDMRDAHAILKQITIPDGYHEEYQQILEQFAKRPISQTLIDVKNISLTNQAFASQIEHALEIILTPANRTLSLILQGYEQSLGSRSSFLALKDGLLSQQETGRHKALCALIDLQRESPEMQQLIGLKDILRKYIPDFDQKLETELTQQKIKHETELTRQMIEKIDEQFAQLEQRVQRKDYNDLIEDLKLLEPSELTPTVQSAIHYYQKCNSLILSFRETLSQQSQECMVDLTKNLVRSTEDFSHNLGSFQKSLDQERNFSQVLPGLESKLRALNIERGQMVLSLNQTQHNSVLQAFAREVETFVGSLSGLPVDDEKWTQCLLKLCILSAQFSGEFDGLRKRLLDQFSNMIELGVRKSYRLIFDDKNILRNFKEERQQGAAGPALAMLSLMRSISQVKTNVENLLKNHFASSLKELDMIVNDLITAIVSSISKDLMTLLEPHSPLLLSGKRPEQQFGETANPEVESFQIALDLIGIFAQSAHESKLQDIFFELKSLQDRIISNSKKVFQECTDNFCQYLQPQVSSDLKIQENTEICKDYEHILKLRQVSQVKDATAEVFYSLQKRVQEIVRNHTNSIRESLKKLAQDDHRKQSAIDQEEFLNKISQQVQEFKYFSDILEIDLQIKETMKKSILSTFETCMRELYGKINLQHVENPKEWEKISKVARIVEDYVKIKDIFAQIGINANKSQDMNITTDFARAVCTAMDTIYDSLRKPILFMTPAHYQEFANYSQYLEIIKNNKQMYLPDQQQQKLAQRMTDHIKLLLKKQIDQLAMTFEYRFRRYLFSENNERDRYEMVLRPSPIQFSIEENKSDAQSQEELDSQSIDQRINSACSEVKKLVQVPYWLIQMQIHEDTRNKEIHDPLSDFLKNLLFNDIAELYLRFKKYLLFTLFDGFDVTEERLKYESERESSLFYYKLKVAKELKQLDTYFDMTNEEADSKEIQGQAKQKYRAFFDAMKHEDYEYSCMDSAIKQFENAKKQNVREEATNGFKLLYGNKKFKKLSEDLKLKESVPSINNLMIEFIKDEVTKTLNILRRKIQDFENPDGEIKEISHLILELDAIAQFLPGYVDVQEINENIKKAIDNVQKVLDDAFKSINQQSEKFQYDHAIKRLYSINMMIQRMQTFYSDSTQLDSFPSKRNQMQDFFTYIQAQIKDRRSQINTQLGKTLSDYHAIITNGKAQLQKILQEQGYSAATIINSIEQLEAKDTEWADTKIQVSSFVQIVKNKFNSTLDQINFETIERLEELHELIKQINNLSETLYFLPDIYFKVLLTPIEAKLDAALSQNEKIQKNTIDGAFETKDAEVIAKVIKENQKVIDQKFILTLNDKFSRIIRPICQDGQRIFCAVQVQSGKILEYMQVQVPKIQSFLQNAELESYIHDSVHYDYDKQVKGNLKNLHHYNLCFIQRRIEMGSKPLQNFEKKAVEKERDDNLKIDVADPDDALDIIHHINQASTKKQVIDGYDLRLQKFFKACAEHFNQLVIQLKEAIRTNSSATIIILVDDIASNDKFVSKSEFIQAFEINYNKETKINYEFVQAIRQVLRSEEPKKLLHKWGQDRQKQLKEIDFTTKTTQKSSKNDRSNYYGKFIITFKELEEVASRVSAHEFFDYKGMKLRSYQESAQQEVGQKVQNMKDNFNQAVEQNLAIGETRNLLSQKESRDIDTYFEQINSGYQNLESIVQHFTIIDPQMKEEIKESLNEFKHQIDTRIKNIQDEAKMRCNKTPQENSYIDREDLIKIAQILIEIQLMKKNFIKFKEQFQDSQDAIIEDYEHIQEEKKNRGCLDNLIKLVHGQDWGAQIIKECSAFKMHNQGQLAKKLNTKNVYDVLKQIKGEDISVKDDKLKTKDNFREDDQKIPTGKSLLLQKYDEFFKIYQRKLKDLTYAKYNDEGEILPIDLKSIVTEIRNIKLSKQKWDDANIERLPELLALIFALWSLQNPELLQQQQKRIKKQEKEDQEELKESESKQQKVDFLGFLNQPHPAQILGIMRILGVGYAPHQYVDTEKKGGFVSGFKKLFGFDKTKIRNNLVQIKTGEGKSVTLAVLSIVFALCDFDVRCACYSAYLSERDFKAFEEMFKILDLKDQIIYNTFNQICEMEINKSGELRQIMLNLALKKQEKVEIKSDSKPRPQVLLIDEVDVFFSESFFGNTYMPQAQIKGPEVHALTDYIWENRDQGLTFSKVSVTQQYQQVLALFQDKFAFLLIESVRQMLVDLLDVPKFKLGVEVEGMFNMDIIDGCIMYKVGDSWSPKVRDSYRTMFAYYYYSKNPQPGKDSISLETLQEYKAIGINFTQLSFAEIPLQFTLLLGVTGTLDTLSEEQQKIMKNVYNFISKTYAPSVYDIPKELKEKIDLIDGLTEEIVIMNEAQERELGPEVTNAEFIIVKDMKVNVVNEMQVKIIDGKDKWFQELAKRIPELIITKNIKEENLENQRAVIVFFKSEEILNEFLESEHFDQLKSYKYSVLTDKLDNDERDTFVTNATIQGQITLSTREFGRGTDFKYHGNGVINAGGLAVIQTFFTFDYSEEIQIRGRTRRQGTTGSYEIIVSLEDLYQLLVNEDSFVESLNGLDPKQIYRGLHQKGLKAYEMKQRAKMQTRKDLKPKHEQFMSHLENIKRSVKGEIVKDEDFEKVVKMLYELNQCPNYDSIFSKKERCIKTLVLIDATYSMGSLLKNVQETILQYFDEVCKSLKQAKYNQNLFKIQIAFYRNYNDGENILKVSPWAGPTEKQTLKKFVDNEKADGGTNISANEAMEIAFWHANKEINSPSDGGEPVSLIFVMGDIPSNTKQEILRLKYKSPRTVNPSMTDEEARSRYGYQAGWNESLQAKYGDSTTWDAQLDKIKKFEDEDGFKIPVQSLYVSSDNKAKAPLEEFYSRLRVNNTLEERGRLLNLSHGENLVSSLCVYTMNMIAEKNPEGGNKVLLQSLAGEMHRKQLAFA